MREDETASTEQAHSATSDETSQPQLPEIAEAEPAPPKRTRRRSTAAAQTPPAQPVAEETSKPQDVVAEAPSDEAATTEPAADQKPEDEKPPEKPKRRPARRRATAAATDEPATATDEPAVSAQPTQDETPQTSKVEVSKTPKVEVSKTPEVEASEAPEAEAEAEAEVEAETQPDTEQLTFTSPFVVPQTRGQSSDADEGDDVQPFVTSLAPRLSHVDVGQDDVDVAPPAVFNPFALFQAPEQVVRPAAPRRDEDQDDHDSAGDDDHRHDDHGQDDDSDDDDSDSGSRRRRRGRRGRGRRSGEDTDGSDDSSTDERDSTDAKGSSNGKDADKGGDEKQATESKSDSSGDSDSGDDEGESSSRRRRRRRRRGSDGDHSSNGSSDDHSDSSADKVKGVSGSVRLEAKRQRRKEGRDHGRRRAPILTEAEFLARRESVTRKMVVRQQGERTQIAVLEDDVLVEHYVTLASEQSFAGGVYYGRVQNVLPSMEAAFIDIGKRRNAVLYAGEVNWDAAGLEGKQRSIEHALKSGDKVLVQVTKDPIGHKGARLTSQISLPGRYLVYVPGGSMTGISRKLPEQERQRLKEILRRIVPEHAGVIIRTAAEGASEEELRRDVDRLKAQWEVIQAKAADTKTKAPSVLYEEPDLAIRVVRDLFNEDFEKMVVSGEGAWDTISEYISHVASDLHDRIERAADDEDVFAANRIDEQLAKALDRKVWLPSGGSLVIDHTEAMTVIDVNTGKFTGSGGNLEQTVTKNNLEAAEEIVNQLRLRDVGGIVVIDFIDMLLESNRELVLRRLTECLGRDRTKHQVAEVTSLGLVQMTRKRVGQGLLDAFSEPCTHCDGRGVIVHSEPVEKKTASTGTEPNSRRNSRSRRGRDAQQPKEQPQAANEPRRDSTTQLSAIAAASHKPEDAKPDDDPVSAAAVDDAQPDTKSQPEPDAPQEPTVTPQADASDTAAAADRAATAEPSATPEPVAVDVPQRPATRRRRAARRPAGPPTPHTT